MTGLRDYVNKNGFPGVVLGMSGGIDSALAAAIAVDALGADRVWGVMLPSPYTSRASTEDAQASARMLGCKLDTIEIAEAMKIFDGALSSILGDRLQGIVQENIQSRCRGLILMGCPMPPDIWFFRQAINRKCRSAMRPCTATCAAVSRC